ncbi:unnamed protein product [Pylaiella littoralis]
MCGRVPRPRGSLSHAVGKKEAVKRNYVEERWGERGGAWWGEPRAVMETTTDRQTSRQGWVYRLAPPDNEGLYRGKGGSGTDQQGGHQRQRQRQREGARES